MSDSAETSPHDDFRPTATWETLRARNALKQVVREFFEQRGYLEVETPILSRDIVVDAWLEPFRIARTSPTEPERYLQTSPEFALKRLLASGGTAIFELARVFRRDERGTRHNPEFTMLEWYRVGDTHLDQMQFVEDLVRSVFAAACSPIESFDASFPRLAYDAAFERFAGRRILHCDAGELRELAIERNVVLPESLSPDDLDGWRNLLLAELVEPELAKLGPVFLFDFPASQAALAHVRPDDLPVAERFELYCRGIELCNGYHELTDPAELRRRIDVQSAIRERAGLPPLPRTSRLLEAMDAGLPPCAGVALGFDRLVMLALGLSSVMETLTFPWDRA